MPKKKILVLMKRFGSNKDMVKDNFGREIRLFEQLAKKYKIDFICPDYKLREKFHIKKNGIDFFVVPFSLFDPFTLLVAISSMIRENKYDVIIPTTEPIFGIIGYHFAKKFNIPIIYEVQDNYDIYASYKIPFIKMLDYRVIRKSDYVFYSNYPLMKKLEFLRKRKIEIIENGIDLSQFRIIKKRIARERLKIKQNLKLIAYTGHISKDRGIELLIQAIKELHEEDDSIHLLLSGKVDKDINIRHPFIIYEELPKREQLVMALNASDVLVIASPDNAFTRYCFPQKLPEYMAVNVPIVATAVGDVIRILEPFNGSLCKPDSMEDLKNKINMQLKRKNINYRKIAMNYTWEKLSKKIDRIIVEVIK